MLVLCHRKMSQRSIAASVCVSLSEFYVFQLYDFGAKERPNEDFLIQLLI
jgi:hypothetical protein